MLASLFPSWCGSYQSFPGPPANGESIEQLHDRCAGTLTHIIRHVDGKYPKDKVTIVICTHAAPLIAIGRVLTGFMPKDATKDDFKTFTCGVSLFERRPNGYSVDVTDNSVNDGVSLSNQWEDGRGLEGGWDCVLNGDCRHLAGGGERAW